MFLTFFKTSEMSCKNCDHRYIGQTHRSMKTRFKQHMANFKLERINKSVQHALDNKNTIHYLRILNIRNDDYNEQ